MPRLQRQRYRTRLPGIALIAMLVGLVCLPLPIEPATIEGSTGDPVYLSEPDTLDVKRLLQDSVQVLTTDALETLAETASGEIFTHATDCPANVTTAGPEQYCRDLDDGHLWRCVNPTLTGSALFCDDPSEWASLIMTNVAAPSPGDACSIPTVWHNTTSNRLYQCGGQTSPGVFLWSPLNPTVQEVCDGGPECAYTNLVEPRILKIQPEKDTLGSSAPRLIFKGESGFIRMICKFGFDPEFDCDPFEVNLPVDGTLYYTWNEGVGTSVFGSITNNGGTSLSGTGIFAKTFNPDPLVACAVVSDVDATDDNQLFGLELPYAVTITSVGCRYQGSAPTTAATFTLEDGAGNAMTITGTNPTCVAPNAAITYAAVTAGNVLSINEPLRFDVTNTPNPATDTYQLCVRFQK